MICFFLKGRRFQSWICIFVWLVRGFRERYLRILFVSQMIYINDNLLKTSPWIVVLHSHIFSSILTSYRRHYTVLMTEQHMLLYHWLRLNLKMKSNVMLAIFKHSANKEGMVGIGSVLRSTLTSIYLQTPQDQESLNISQDVYVWIAQNIFYDIGYGAIVYEIIAMLCYFVISLSFNKYSWF